jgi:two-component system CheB/CheR fusion protein
VVDLRLPIEEIATQIARYAQSVATVAESGTAEEVPDEIEEQVSQIATILRNVTTNDFHGYKRGTFVRRVQRRMQVTQTETVPAYVARLREDRGEVQHLFQDLLIGVTQFFRDPLEFEALEREIPRLFESREAEEPLRVWVLGCATGEEAYSIAILLREHMATLDNPPGVQIFATDLDARALNLARAGRYSQGIADHVRPDRLERWFVREGDTYCVARELREMCIFSPHNIVKDAPFSRTDILSCRNLLIYLNAELQNRVIPIFHFSLRPGGVLFLGSSENVTRHQKLFAPVDRRNRVFRRLETAMRVIPDFPLTSRARVPEPQQSPNLAQGMASRLAATTRRQAEAVAERYAPAYVVVDAQYDVLHFSGRTGRYLEPSAGAASLNLVNLVHRDLRLELRSALGQASVEGRRIELPRLVVQDDHHSRGAEPDRGAGRRPGDRDAGGRVPGHRAGSRAERGQQRRPAGDRRACPAAGGGAADYP